MGFFSECIGAVVKTALTPIAVVKDLANIATGQEVDATKELIESAGDDIKNAFSDLEDGKIL